jgi:hypothetical protein
MTESLIYQINVENVCYIYDICPFKYIFKHLDKFENNQMNIKYL